MLTLHYRNAKENFKIGKGVAASWKQTLAFEDSFS